MIAELTGLTPGEHGFHVHEFGDCSMADGTCAGGHFNPTGAPHGGPDDAKRHVGDLGNIKADASGKATYKRVDKMLALNGPNSIIGRSIIVHAAPDDLEDAALRQRRRPRRLRRDRHRRSEDDALERELRAGSKECGWHAFGLQPVSMLYSRATNADSFRPIATTKKRATAICRRRSLFRRQETAACSLAVAAPADAWRWRARLRRRSNARPR